MGVFTLQKRTGNIATKRAAGAVSLLFVAAGLAFAATCDAQGWKPQRHVELVVPGGAGGSLDITARAVHKLLESLKLLPVPATVVNRPGAAHVLAYNAVKARHGDPHHLGIATSMLLTAHITGRLPYTYADVTPIAFLMTEYVAFAVPADSPIKTGRDLIEALKKNPESLSFGMGSSRGGTYHIALGLPLQSAGVNTKALKIAFFAGSGGGVQQVLGGHVDVSISGLSPVLQHVESGALRVIAISAPRRIAGTLAGVPTWEEQGYKGAFGSWRSVFAPKEITSEQVAYWEEVFRRVVDSPEFRRSAETNHWQATFRGAAETRKYMEAEYAQLASVMDYLGLLQAPGTAK